MGWNRMSSRSVAAQSWLNVIDVNRDRLRERLCGYGFGLILVKDATTCEIMNRSRMGKYEEPRPDSRGLHVSCFA